MKAAPLLRKWLHRLRDAGAKFHVRHRWLGWREDGALNFATPLGEQSAHADVVILALGGGSWARLGSDAAWVPLLERRGIRITPLQSANCGFDIGWSEHFRSRFAGQPLKSVVASFTDSHGVIHLRQGECIITDSGIEGGLVYALCAPLRTEIAARGAAVIYLDLLPGREPQRVLAEVAHPRGAKSLSTHLQSHLGIKGVKAGLLREAVPKEDFADPGKLAAVLKALPLRLVATRPIDEAISTAGGVALLTVRAPPIVPTPPGVVFPRGEIGVGEAPPGQLPA